MNLHLNRRLEVLAREIAEAKKPRINTEESRLFAEVAQRPYAKTLGDLKNNGAAKASQKAAEVGTARPSPEAAPPNIAADLADASHATAGAGMISYETAMASLGAPSVQRLKVGTQWLHKATGRIYKESEDGRLVSWDEGKTWELSTNKQKWWDESLQRGDIAVISPASETEGEGWVTWAGGECPVPDGQRHKVRFRDGEEALDDAPETWTWEHLGKDSDIVAYKVIA